MKRMMIGILATAILALPAVAEPYQKTIDGLMRASYRYMELTYACRHVNGLAQYRNAEVAAENAVRATGMPTDVAMSTVARMASRIRAASSSGASADLHVCTVDIVQAKRQLLDARAKFRRSQQ